MLVLALLSTFLMAQQKPKAQIQEIRATGCVRRAVESQCLLLETLDGSTTYTYEVRSVDDSGVESTASNEFTATIP